MAKFVLIGFSDPNEGRADDFHEWYENAHIPDICAIPGVQSARRFEACGNSPLPVVGNHLAIYEIETDDIDSVAAELGRRGKSGELRMSDAINRQTSKIWFYRQI